MAEVVFEARGITKVYRSGEREVQALRGADVDLHAGEIAVMLGPPGSGKSTLLNILGGLDRPTSGTIRFRDLDLTRVSERELARYRREHVGFVFQFHNLIPALTVRENVALVTGIAGQSLETGEALMLVGLEDCMDVYPAQLSGGEQQRVAIAQAISKRPDILLCDEPTGALDGELGAKVLDALASVNRTLGTTTAIITHDAALQSMANRVFTLGDGRVISVRVNDRLVKPSELV